MFSKSESRVLSERYVAVRITGGDDLTPEANEFMTEYAVTGYPTLYVMNAEGHVVVDRVGRTLEAMLDALELGAQREVEFDALRERTDPASRVEFGRMLCDRMLMDEAETVFTELLAEAPSAAAHEGLAKLHARRGERARERRLLTEMLALYPEADGRTSWRIRLASMGLDGVRSRSAWREKLTETVALLEELHTAVAQEGGGPLAEAEVRTKLGGYLSMAGRNDDALAHLDWVLEHAGESRLAPAALLARARVRWRQGEWARCKSEFERILREFPESEEARVAPRGIRNCDLRLGRDK